MTSYPTVDQDPADALGAQAANRRCASKARGSVRAESGGLGRTSALVLLSFGTAQATSAITFLFAARHAGPEAFGRVVSLVGVVATVVGIVDFGGNTLVTREVAARRMSLAGAAGRITTKALVMAALGAILGMALRLVNLVTLTEAALAGLCGVAMTVSLGLQCILRGIGKATISGWLSALDKVLGLGTFTGLSAFVGLRPSLALLVALCAGPVIASTLGALWLALTVGVRRIRLISPYRGSLGFGLTSTATSLATLDAPTIAAIGGSVAAGHYGAVARWVNPLNLVSSAFVQAALPVLTAEPSTRSAMRRLRSGGWLLAASWVFAAATAALSPWMVPRLLGPGYEHSAPVLALLALSTIPSGISQVALTMLQARGRENAAAGRMLVAVFTQLLSIGIGSAILGGAGAAVGVLGAQVMLVLLLIREVLHLLVKEDRLDD